MFALAVATVSTSAARLAAQQLQLHFFDVCQGDAALLITPENKTMLVDAGQDARPVIGATDRATAAIRRLNRLTFADDADGFAVLLPLRDGVTVVLKR